MTWNRRGSFERFFSFHSCRANRRLRIEKIYITASQYNSFTRLYIFFVWFLKNLICRKWNWTFVDIWHRGPSSWAKIVYAFRDHEKQRNERLFDTMLFKLIKKWEQTLLGGVRTIKAWWRTRGDLDPLENSNPSHTLILYAAAVKSFFWYREIMDRNMYNW